MLIFVIILFCLYLAFMTILIQWTWYWHTSISYHPSCWQRVIHMFQSEPEWLLRHFITETDTTHGGQKLPQGVGVKTDGEAVKWWRNAFKYLFWIANVTLVSPLYLCFIKVWYPALCKCNFISIKHIQTVETQSYFSPLQPVPLISLQRSAAP